MSDKRNIPSGLMALKKIVEGTSEGVGFQFFRSLVKKIAEVFQAHGVWVTEYIHDQNQLNALAFWLDGGYVDEYRYEVGGTPCEPVINGDNICFIPDRVIELFPDDPDIRELGAVSYMGIPLRDEDGSVLGHLAMLDNKPMEEVPEGMAIFEIFASRAKAELKRVKTDRLLIENEGKLNRLINGAHEAIIEVNEQLKVTQANECALKAFETIKEDITDLPLDVLFDDESYTKISNAINSLSWNSEYRSPAWIQGRVTCKKQGEGSFPAEVTLSKYLYNHHYYFALFIRNVEAQLQQQEVMKSLNAEASMLREKVQSSTFDDIIGTSAAIQKTLELVNQVAPADTTVMIYGETGTGKELIAQAIHKASNRKDKTLITLNCAALPAELIESELFGHKKGAFTGAAYAREGRFSMAHGSTLFLDEIGELPLPLQAKLLRVLQEGTFEPVGSSETQKVDVRVIAATNRNLQGEVDAGNFREDLYYRLNVFPIPVPPLRERGEDINLIAQAFVDKYCQRFGLAAEPLSEVNKQALLAYPWPGNIRELQNIVERAVITHVNGKLNFVPLLNMENRAPDTVSGSGSLAILTDEQIKEMEKQNILRALERTDWKISGEQGAAQLLQIPPTTLSSRIKKLGINRVTHG